MIVWLAAGWAPNVAMAQEPVGAPTRRLDMGERFWGPFRRGGTGPAPVWASELRRLTPELMTTSPDPGIPTAVGAARASLVGCLPAAAVHARVRLIAGPDGTVWSTSVVSLVPEGAEVEACLVKEAQALTLPKADSARVVTFDVPKG